MENDFGTTPVDGMSQWIDDHSMMLLNSCVPVDRKRWTLAHELGHLELHSEFVTGDVEAEADEFAAAFLMPSEVIRPALRKPKLGTLIDLKQEWGVSTATLIQRAHSPQAITPTERTRLFKLLSAIRFRNVEPGSDLLVPKQPQLLDHLRQSLESRGLDAEEIARIAGFRCAADNTLMPTPTHHLRVVYSMARALFVGFNNRKPRCGGVSGGGGPLMDDSCVGDHLGSELPILGPEPGHGLGGS